LIFFISCSSGEDDLTDPVPQDIIPTNLSLTINIVGLDTNNPNGDGSGVVQFMASATNAVKYGFKFGSEAEQESVSGTISHTYTDSGINSYLVTVFAYSSTGNSISTFETIAVFVGDQIQLVWSDEFDIDGPVDANKWHHQIEIPSGGNWYNGEQQHYTNRLDNSYVSNGLLKIVAKKESFSDQGYTKAYTSARLNSKFAFTYGRVDIRAKLPNEAGTWPALWMLGKDIDEDGGYWDEDFGVVNWPVSGEIDIMEQTGWDKNKVLGTCHWFDNASSANASYGQDITVSNVSTEFHVYSMEWTETYIKMLVDDIEYYEIALNNDLPFNKDFYFLFNIAMGGTLGGTIDASFTEDTMEIDYVRVYQ
jgi:beta-glucanase (GH16 family)